MNSKKGLKDLRNALKNPRLAISGETSPKTIMTPPGSDDESDDTAPQSIALSRRQKIQSRPSSPPPPYSVVDDSDDETSSVSDVDNASHEAIANSSDNESLDSNEGVAPPTRRHINAMRLGPVHLELLKKMQQGEVVGHPVTSGELAHPPSEEDHTDEEPPAPPSTNDNACNVKQRELPSRKQMYRLSMRQARLKSMQQPDPSVDFTQQESTLVTAMPSAKDHITMKANLKDLDKKIEEWLAGHPIVKHIETYQLADQRNKVGKITQGRLFRKHVQHNQPQSISETEVGLKLLGEKIEGSQLYSGCRFVNDDLIHFVYANLINLHCPYDEMLKLCKQVIQFIKIPKAPPIMSAHDYRTYVIACYKQALKQLFDYLDQLQKSPLQEMQPLTM